MKLSALAKYARRLAVRWMRRSHTIGAYRVELPPGHMLDEHQQAFLNYDKKLPLIAKLVAAKYEHVVTVDIGANIGDSAVAIRSAIPGPIICVEGNPAFLPYLHTNLKGLPGTNRVIPKFIRASDEGADDYEIRTSRGTAHLVPKATSTPAGIEPATTTIREIFVNNADLGTVRLIKSDTDGYDFAILLSALDTLSEYLPVLYFEFDPLIGSSSGVAAIKMIEGLRNIGYEMVIVYDNYGNYLVGSALTLDLARDLVASVSQSARAGGGVKYFDLCCFSGNDIDIFHAVVNGERCA